MRSGMTVIVIVAVVFADMLVRVGVLAHVPQNCTLPPVMKDPDR